MSLQLMVSAPADIRCHGSCIALQADMLSGGLLAVALMISQQAMAQDRNADAELEALIPDTALDDPDRWVEQGATGTSSSGDVQQLDSSETDDRAFSLPSPDVAQDFTEIPVLEPEAGTDTALGELDGGKSRQNRADASDVETVSPRVTLVFSEIGDGFPEKSEFIARFRALSTIEQLSGAGEDAIAQLSVRARSDRGLLGRLLRAYGYYDSEVAPERISSGTAGTSLAERPSVRFSIRTGTRYRFGELSFGELANSAIDTARLRDSIGIGAGDPLYADHIVSGRTSLVAMLAETGFPFAKVGEPQLTIDRERQKGDLMLPVSPGGKYVFGAIASSLPRYLSAEHLQRISRFDTGDIYSQSKVEDLRRTILATGLISSVAIKPKETQAQEGSVPGEVALDVELTKAPPRTISGEIGYDSGEGVRTEIAWEHRNLFPPEGRLRVRGIAGTKEQLASVTFQRNNFTKRDLSLTTDLFAQTSYAGAVRAKSLTLDAKLERRANYLNQRRWQWGVGIEATMSSEAIRAQSQSAQEPRTTYYIGAVPMDLRYDGSDNLYDPSRGIRAEFSASPEYSRGDGGMTTTYLKLQIDASFYQPVGSNLTLAARARLGSIVGEANNLIAPSRRFFAGGANSVRGFGYQHIGPLDPDGNPTGGRSLTEFSIEARAKTGLLAGALNTVAFVDAGTVDESSAPGFRDIRFGAGLGLRYQTGIGPLRLDIATPLNRRKGEGRIAVYIGLGQAF